MTSLIGPDLLAHGYVVESSDLDLRTGPALD